MDIALILDFLKQLVEFRNQLVEENTIGDIISYNDETDSIMQAISDLDALKQFDDKYVRLLADFDNFRKRVERTKVDTVKNALLDLLTKILPSLDNVDKAILMVDPSTASRNENGMLMAFDGIKKSLANVGCVQIDKNVGDEFDYNECEAIGTMPSSSIEVGKIGAIASIGWKFNGVVVIPSKVLVVQEN